MRLDARGEHVRFTDRLHGDVVGTVDDFVLWRGDGTPAYNLAVVVDDADQGIRRGGARRRPARHHASPAPPESLARATRANARHVPLVLGPDGERLAKRHGAVTLAERRERGETPADALGWMAATLQLAERGSRVRAADLVERFDPARLPREPEARLIEVIDPGVSVGHVHLKVADLERAIGFYRDVLGFELQQQLGDQAAFLSAGGYHHHIGLNTWESRGGPAPPPGTTGLFHAAFLYPTREALAKAVRKVVDAGIPLTGASDHGVSEAIYLNDPDGNGVELYWDRPQEEWPREADGTLALFTAPLDLQALLAVARLDPCPTRREFSLGLVDRLHRLRLARPPRRT